MKSFLSTNIGLNNESFRQEWVKKQLLKLESGQKILDAGAGEQQYKQYCSHLDYTSQDIAQYDGLGDDKGLQMGKWNCSQIDIISDILDIPLEDESFDAIICTEVLEHIPKPIEALKELSRLLKPNGKIILTAPFGSLTHFAPYHYCDGFNIYWYNYHLPKINFEIIEIERNGNYFTYLAQELRRLNSMRIKYTNLRSNYFIMKFINFSIRIILKFLDKLDKNNKNSEELLCFGYHILAKKK